jgi:hypothetical protein
MSVLKISMACWQIADEASTRRKVQAASQHRELRPLARRKQRDHVDHSRPARHAAQRRAVVGDGDLGAADGSERSWHPDAPVLLSTRLLRRRKPKGHSPQWRAVPFSLVCDSYPRSC